MWWVEPPSNSFAEFLGHIGAVVLRPDRRTMGMILLDSIMELKINGPTLAKFLPIVKAAMLFWFRDGHRAAECFDAATTAVCDRHVARYNDELEWYGDAWVEQEFETAWQRKVAKRRHRNNMLAAMCENVCEALLAEVKARVAPAAEQEDERATWPAAATKATRTR